MNYQNNEQIHDQIAEIEFIQHVNIRDNRPDLLKDSFQINMELEAYVNHGTLRHKLRSDLINN